MGVQTLKSAIGQSIKSAVPRSYGAFLTLLTRIIDGRRSPNLELDRELKVWLQLYFQYKYCCRCMCISEVVLLRILILYSIPGQWSQQKNDFHKILLLRTEHVGTLQKDNTWLRTIWQMRCRSNRGKGHERQCWPAYRFRFTPSIFHLLDLMGDFAEGVLATEVGDEISAVILCPPSAHREVAAITRSTSDRSLGRSHRSVHRFA